MFDYQQFFHDANQSLKRERRYRVFRELQRLPGQFPVATWKDAQSGAERPVVVWCSNDYLGMSQHPKVIAASCDALECYGAGAGGTRNISGTHALIAALEAELAALHQREAALVFSSGFVANDATLSALGAALPQCMLFSDANNHASMIAGMRRSGAAIRVFAHNEPQALTAALAAAPPQCPKIVAFESLYSMDGDIAPLRELLSVASQYGALTFVDETHAVGVHGAHGGGLLEAAGLLDQVDIVQGGLGKGYGVVGGFITASAQLVDFVRSHAAGFIFTTALPPAVAAGALASVRHLAQSPVERQQLFAGVNALRTAFETLQLPLMPTRSQILPLLVGDAGRCNALADHLLRDHGIYLQPINYPTVARGTERLRITPTPRHSAPMQQALVAALAGAYGSACVAPQNRATDSIASAYSAGPAPGPIIAARTSGIGGPP